MASYTKAEEFTTKLITVRVSSEDDMSYLQDKLDRIIIGCPDRTIEVVETVEEEE